jgi:hypothetical protein
MSHGDEKAFEKVPAVYKGASKLTPETAASAHLRISAIDKLYDNQHRAAFSPQLLQEVQKRVALLDGSAKGLLYFQDFAGGAGFAKKLTVTGYGLLFEANLRFNVRDGLADVGTFYLFGKDTSRRPDFCEKALCVFHGHTQLQGDTPILPTLSGEHTPAIPADPHLYGVGTAFPLLRHEP